MAQDRVGERTASGARGGPEEVGPDKLEVVLVDLLPLDPLRHLRIRASAFGLRLSVVGFPGLGVLIPSETWIRVSGIEFRVLGFWTPSETWVRFSVFGIRDSGFRLFDPL